MTLPQKVYEPNKKKWWGKQLVIIGYELHHIWGRVGVFLCCPHFWIRAEHGHTDNWRWTKMLRELYAKDKLALESNYVKGNGCKKELFGECGYCKMPIPGRENGKRKTS